MLNVVILPKNNNDQAPKFNIQPINQRPKITLKTNLAYLQFPTIV